jgi:MFS family permease
MPSPREFTHGPWRAVLVLGVTQILAWGTIFYTPVLIVPLIAAEHSWSMAFSMAGFSVCLLVAGLIAPFVGRSIDRFGGHVVMTAGSLIGALGLALLAYVDTPVAYFAVWVVLGTALSASLYDAAFGTLGRIFGAAARRPITALTLAGGFASTAGWPATHFLIEAVGWRGTYLVYAALLAFVCAPLHAFLLPRGRTEIVVPKIGDVEAPQKLLPSKGLPFILVASAFAAYAFVPSGLSAHLLAIFSRAGIDAGTVVWMGGALRARHFAVRVRDAGGARRLGAGGGGLRADVRRRQRARHHHTRRGAVGAVRRLRLRAADGAARGAVPAGAGGGASGYGVRGRSRLRFRGVGAGLQLCRRGAGLFHRDQKAGLTHDPEKWEPVFGKDHAQKCQPNIMSMSCWLAWPASRSSLGPLSRPHSAGSAVRAAGLAAGMSSQRDSMSVTCVSIVAKVVITLPMRWPAMSWKLHDS